MQQFISRLRVIVLAAMFTVAPSLTAADHGPVFGLATPTNPKGDGVSIWE